MTGTASCRQCCAEGCRYHGRHGSRSCNGCSDAINFQIRKGRIPLCAECGCRDQAGRLDERQTKQFFCSRCWARYEGDRLLELFDPPDELDAKCVQLANMLKNAKYIIAFTGAGISTGAGIADFRSGCNTVLPTGPGLWERPKSAEGTTNILEQCAKAQPGRSHLFLFRLWKAGMLKHIISQNVDGLHRKSGIAPSALSELHGNIFVERCQSCQYEYERSFNTICQGGFTGRFCERPGCNGRLRHSGVGFGDDLPASILDRAWEETSRCDLCLALGSSITVTPASEMPAWVARKHGKQSSRGLVIVNLQVTPCDTSAVLRINGFTDEVLERVESILCQGGTLPNSTQT